MGELPEGVDLPVASVAIPRPSASLIISRLNSGKEEILLCHRVSEVPSFPDFWAFPGGGVSRVDRKVAEENPSWLAHTEEPVSTITLLRELVEEVGFSPDGKGSLELVDSDDPLEAGLEMLVSPPGKRLQSITLLSGGEQALTALSLIFAVFLTNPAPICVLDEVDAPLDDANVSRFCELLDEMCRQTETRFMIITHHAITMSRMDRLFGVTMQEQGVSQLVSVDLRKAESLVA